MKKTYSKFCCIIVGIVFMLTMNMYTAFAAEEENQTANNLDAMAVVTIENNQTGEIETFYEKISDLKITELNELQDGETECVAEASINLEHFIKPRLSHGTDNTDVFGVIKARIYYVSQGSGSNLKIKTTKYTGDIEFSDPAFYAKDRHFVFNEATGRYKCCELKPKKCPTKDSWSIDSFATTYERVSSDLPISVYYKATIYCVGMSGFSQTVSVTCPLTQTAID